MHDEACSSYYHLYCSSPGSYHESVYRLEAIMESGIMLQGKSLHFKTFWCHLK